MDTNYLNEETIKTKIVLPYLETLGFSLNDVDFETNFKIKLGRKETISGRSDLLCKKGDKNLFVIEVKADNLKISTNEIEQGISYARLTHPITPFLIVTNGKDTRIFDVIKKNELDGYDIGPQSKFWKNGCILSSDDEIEQRYEAVRHFIGYSYENLKLFSSSQVDDRMQVLKGSKKELHKKYIPELFLSRKDLIDNFSDFMDNSSQCFAIVGESGVGKTNFICGLVDYFKEKHITLFFNTAVLNQTIIESIKEDFNWIFSAHLEAKEILKRLESLASGKCKICFFFDAIDESPNGNFGLELDDFIRKLKNFEKIKVCISCKSSEWNRFLRIRDNPSYLSETIFQTKNSKGLTSTISKFELDNENFRQKPGYIVNRFNEDEIKLLDKKYRNCFNYEGKLLGEIREECKLGFMLRIVAEVSQNGKLPEFVEIVSLFRTYLNKKLEKLNSPDLARRYLIEIGKILIKKEGIVEINMHPGYIEEYELRKSLNLSIAEEISPDLFSYGLLIRSCLENGQKIIGFYNTKIRDYVVSILSLELNTLNKEDFKNILPKLMKGLVGQSAITWYYSVANQEHKEVFKEYKHTRALMFLETYNSIIERHFPKLKESFLPNTTGKIGIMLEQNEEIYNEWWGFLPLSHEDEQTIQYISPKSDIERNKHLIERKVNGFRYQSISFFNTDPVKTAKEEVKDQLEEIIRKGRLNEENNFGLMLEKILNIVYNYHRELSIPSNIDRNNFFSPFIYDFLPINCDALFYKIKRFYLRKFFEWEMIKKRKIIDTSRIDRNEIERSVEHALETNQCIPELDIRGHFPPFKILKRLLRIYKEKKGLEITEPLFPPPDITNKSDLIERDKQFSKHSQQAGNRLILQYSDNRLKEYIRTFFYRAIQEYKTLVETCFPSIKNKLPFYSKLPITLHFEVYFKPEWPLWYWYKRNDSGNTIVEGTINPIYSKIPVDNDEYIIAGTSLCYLFRSNSSYAISPEVSTGTTDDMCVLRNRVLDWINDESRYILNSF